MSEGWKYFIAFAVIEVLLFAAAPGVAILFLGIALLSAMIFFFGTAALVALGLGAKKYTDSKK